MDAEMPTDGPAEDNLFVYDRETGLKPLVCSGRTDRKERQPGRLFFFVRAAAVGRVHRLVQGGMRLAQRRRLPCARIFRSSF